MTILQKLRFDNKEQVYYTTDNYGKGSGNIVGYYDDTTSNDRIWIILTKKEIKNWDYSTICVKESDIVSTPF